MNKLIFIASFLLYFSVNQIDCLAKPKPSNNKKTNLVNQDNYDSLFNKIEKNYSLKVYYKNSKDYFPEFWKTKQINPKFSVISTKELKRFPKILEQVLSRYSLNTIKTNLKSIYLAKTISFYDVEFGATNFTDSIYICSEGIENNYTDKYLIQTLHHEFSSILLRNYDFPQEEWESWNPRGFNYNTGGVDALKEKKDSLDPDDSFLNQGLLSQYSLASLEEDFNVYSGMIFAEPEKFYNLMEKYPAVREKFNIWLRFYNSIDSKFTEEYIFKNKLL